MEGRREESEEEVVEGGSGASLANTSTHSLPRVALSSPLLLSPSVAPTAAPFPTAFHPLGPPTALGETPSPLGNPRVFRGSVNRHG